MNQARLKELLNYDPQTGLWVWLRNDRCAGTIRTDGRRQINVDGVCYLATRLAWLFMTGEWPNGLVDHRKPGKEFRADDRWSELRLATFSQNNANRITMAKSGYKGVKQVPSGKFQAKFKKHLGTFDTPEEANTAYITAARQEYGEFAYGGSL